MSSEDDKRVVRRFWDDLIAAGNADVAKEILAPDYKGLLAERLNADKPILAENDAEGLKEAISTYLAAVKDVKFEVLAMVSEGNTVFARFNVVSTQLDGSTNTSRALGYYRLDDGRIALADVMSVTQ